MLVREACNWKRKANLGDCYIGSLASKSEKSPRRGKDAKENKHDPSACGFIPVIPSRTEKAEAHSVFLLSFCRQHSDFLLFLKLEPQGNIAPLKISQMH